MNTGSSEHVVYTNCFLLLFLHSEQFMYTTCPELAIVLNNILLYCGLVDARISASEKDLPVQEYMPRCVKVSPSNTGGILPS